MSKSIYEKAASSDITRDERNLFRSTSRQIYVATSIDIYCQPAMLQFERSYMATATINISIPDNLKAEVEEIIAAEGYGNTSEFFRDLVRDYLQKRQERKLEALLLEGLESGKATPFTKDDFAAIKERGLERLKNKAKR